MLNLFNKEDLSEGSKRIPEDLFSGDGLTQEFALINMTVDIISRVFVDCILIGTDTDFYLFSTSGTSFIYFTSPPGTGTSNIVLQSGTCLFFTGGSSGTSGTSGEGFLNAYRGDSVDIPYYISNDDPAKGYSDVTITPVDFLENSDESGWVTLAETKEDLDTATAGDPLNLGSITDSDTPHTFWARLTVPKGYLSPGTPVLNKYDISFLIEAEDYDL
jgi:hypothetical protein